MLKYHHLLPCFFAFLLAHQHVSSAVTVHLDPLNARAASAFLNLAGFDNLQRALGARETFLQKHSYHGSIFQRHHEKRSDSITVPIVDIQKLRDELAEFDRLLASVLVSQPALAMGGAAPAPIQAIEVGNNSVSALPNNTTLTSSVPPSRTIPRVSSFQGAFLNSTRSNSPILATSGPVRGTNAASNKLQARTGPRIDAPPNAKIPCSDNVQGVLQVQSRADAAQLLTTPLFISPTLPRLPTTFSTVTLRSGIDPSLPRNSPGSPPVALISTMHEPSRNASGARDTSTTSPAAVLGRATPTAPIVNVSPIPIFPMPPVPLVNVSPSPGVLSPSVPITNKSPPPTTTTPNIVSTPSTPASPASSAAGLISTSVLTSAPSSNIASSTAPSAVPTNSKANTSAQLAVYFGQRPTDSNTGLLDLCNKPETDIVILAFLTTFFGPNGYPVIDFASSCGGKTPEMTARAPGLLRCDALASQITQCQAQGKKILLSLGGAIGDSTFDNEAQAVKFADTLWDLFGAGTGEDAALRPFGPVQLDGFDIDNESKQPASYLPFAQRLRALYASSPRSSAYLLTAAPQCPRPDASIPLEVLRLCDYIFIQFYNNPACELAAPDDGFPASFAAWTTDLADSDARLFVGALAWPAGGGGYVDPEVLARQVARIRDSKAFGGISLWDGPEGERNLDAKVVEGGDYLQAARRAMVSA
ncbi:MAG: hypothetical protein M1825_000410 [Sarcosagium campestre]|nr:MAG: hypothetical protein M1825_000410 [Sarcosagium campestre]